MSAREEILATLDTAAFDAGTSPRGRRRDARRREIEHGLDEAGTRLALARRLAAHAALDLADWAGEAEREGVSVAEIARRAGVTRQTVYDWRAARAKVAAPRPQDRK